MFGSDFFDIDINIAVFIILVSAVTLLLQLLLCFKAKRKLIKLLPIAVLAVFAIAFYAYAVYVNGWNGLGYLFFALLSAGLIFVCGIAFGVWAIVRKTTK